MRYEEFIETKVKLAKKCGFDPLPFQASLFEWQKLPVAWAVRTGRAALFEDCGLGKTVQQLEWASQVFRKTMQSVLILCPLSVASQTIQEGQKHGIKVVHVKNGGEITNPGIYITNYERIDLFADSVPDIAGIVLDESSCIKAYSSKTRMRLNALFGQTPFKLCCTATPSPNDYTELGQHADFLGVCSPAQMLATYFINDTFNTGDWRLKKHAEDEFWKWVSSWAACITKPSDLGFADEGFSLPEMEIVPTFIDVDERGKAGGEELFFNADLSASQMNAEMRRTLQDRVNAVKELVQTEPKEQFAVWCNLNDEQDALESALADSVSVRGADDDEEKIERELAWRSGKCQTMISKGSIFGYGMNWQHCARVIVFPTYSFEDFYQIVRRFYRFGQKRKVVVYVVLPRTANRIMQILNRKQNQHDLMRQLMTETRKNLTDNTGTMLQMKTTIDTKTGDGWEIHNGDCVRVAKSKIADNSVGFSVFSPPFADLFTYSSDIQDMGNCGGLDEFMDQFGFLVDELMRVTMPGRECAVHCCDLLATKWKDGAIEFKDFSGAIVSAFRSRGWQFHSRITIWKSPVTEMQRTKAHGLLYKTLMKDSSSSRVGAPDYLLVFKKPGDNPKPINHTENEFPLDLWQEIASPVWMTVDQGRVLNGDIARDQRDERHICPLQLDVIERALFLWSTKGDLVFSPFAGIGSEGYCARKMGRSFVGAELKESYFKTACANLERACEESRDLFSLDKV